MTKLRAVLFDMDGTLTDSEKLWTVALERTAADLGGVLSEPARQAMVGHDMADSIRMLLADIGSDHPADAVATMLTEHTATLFRSQIPWRPGAHSLLAAVRDAGLATALVTATHRRLVELALNTLGRNNFDAVVCGDEVDRNKPDPQPFLRAMSELGVIAAETIAIEDSPNGSTSALAAGLRVLVVPSEIPVAPAAGLTFADSLVDVTVESLHRISALPYLSG